MFGTPLISRAEAGLRAPKCTSTNITKEGDTAHYGGPSPWGSGVDRSSPAAFQATADHNRCASIWRAWQAFHMDSRGWCDIAYSSGVCPHGIRYEGRGPGKRTGAQGTNDGNLRSYATCYIAGDSDPLTEDAKRAFLDEGERLAALRWGHREWHSTGCPGGPIWDWRVAKFPSPGGTAPPPPPPPTLPPSGATTVPVPLPLLRKGNAGGGVRSLQSLLNTKAGQGLVVDGDFGQRTHAAVLNVQTFFGLSRDGIVGQQTWGVLFL